jgi:outer membrane receptor protein involved in Fe transport
MFGADCENRRPMRSLQQHTRGRWPQGEEAVRDIKRIKKIMCLALIALFLVPPGSVAVAATGATTETTVTRSELYDAMSAKTADEAAARKAIQEVLGNAEVRRVAAQAGLDLKQAQAAVTVLSGEELQTVAGQAARVNEALAGGSNVVITSTVLIIGLLVLIVLLVA